MKVTMNKKVLKIIIAIIIIVAVVAVGIFVINVVSNNMKVNDTYNKLSQINAKELENKIIKELENSPLNVNTSTISTTFVVNNDEPTGKGIVYEYMADKYKFITINITDSKTNFIEIDCCKIESDNNGNLKSIEYIDGSIKGGECNFITEIVQDVIKNVLETEYNIDTNVVRDLKYKENQKIKFSFNADKKSVFINGYDFCATALKTISNNSNKHFNENTYYNEIEDSTFDKFYLDTTIIQID